MDFLCISSFGYYLNKPINESGHGLKRIELATTILQIKGRDHYKWRKDANTRSGHRNGYEALKVKIAEDPVETACSVPSLDFCNCRICTSTIWSISVLVGIFWGKLPPTRVTLAVFALIATREGRHFGRSWGKRGPGFLLRCSKYSLALWMRS